MSKQANAWTPGPWIVGRIPIIDAGRKAKYSNVEYALLNVYVERAGEAEANARLIAAAPQMAEALQQMLEDHDPCEHNSGPCEDARAALRAAGVGDGD